MSLGRNAKKHCKPPSFVIFVIYEEESSFRYETLLAPIRLTCASNGANPVEAEGIMQMTSTAVKRLGAKWPAIIERIRGEAATMSAEGMTLHEFGTRLPDVSPDQVGDVARALMRKGVVWMGVHKGMARVFASKPATLARSAEPEPLAELVSRLAPLALVVGRLARAKQHDEFMRRIVAVKAARTIIERAIAGGVERSAIRAALSQTFSSEFQDNINQWGDFADRLGRRPVRAEVSVPEAVFDLIDFNGAKGTTRSALLLGLRPRPKADELADILADLQSTGMIEARRMPGAGLRAAVHFFAEGKVPPAP